MESSWSPCRVYVDSVESSWSPWKRVGQCKVLCPSQKREIGRKEWSFWPVLAEQTSYSMEEMVGPMNYMVTIDIPEDHIDRYNIHCNFPTHNEHTSN
jgi:hypothetical protein